MRPADAQRLLGALAGVDAPVGFAVFDEGHRYLAVNAVLAARTGTSIADHLGRKPSEVLPPAVAQHTDEMIDRVLRTGESVEVDEPSVARPEHDYAPHLRSSWYVIDEGRGREVAMFVVDDTSQRKAVSALRHSRARNVRLLEVADELAQAVTVPEVVAAVEVIGQGTVGALRCGVDLVDNPAARRDLDALARSRSFMSRSVGGAVTPVLEVERTGWPLFIHNREQARTEFPDPRLAEFIDEAGEQAWTLLPLAGSSGRLGVLWFSFADEQVFEPETCRFLRAVAQQCSVALERAQLFEQERTATVSLTQGLLPSRLPGIAGLELGARSVPGSVGHEVGGDWYDAFVLPDGKVSLVVGDVMGHGLPAATGMGQLRAALRALALSDPDPGAVLAGLDRLVERGGSVEMATVVYAVLNPSDGWVRFGDAGHLPMVLIPESGELELVDAGAGTTPLGVSEPRYGRTVHLTPGDVVVAFTDGLVETRRRSLEEGVDLLLRCLEEHRAAGLDIMLDAVIDRMASAGPTDDVTVLALRWVGR